MLGAGPGAIPVVPGGALPGRTTDGPAGLPVGPVVPPPNPPVVGPPPVGTAVVVPVVGAVGGRASAGAGAETGAAGGRLGIGAVPAVGGNAVPAKGGIGPGGVMRPRTGGGVFPAIGLLAGTADRRKL